ncbi:MAG: nucleotidyltransferase domain-containing protein [Verrucomicrobiota bacterium]|jgi:predicted nucleotidyltransferase
MLTNPNTAAVPVLREDVLHDARFPIHKIADRLLPYLRVLLEQFRPEQVILFGSYACGQPNRHSDVDLLVVKELKQSPVREAAQILRAWRPIRWSGDSIPFELLIETPVNHEDRARKQGSFYAEVVRSGVRLA